MDSKIDLVERLEIDIVAKELTRTLLNALSR